MRTFTTLTLLTVLAIPSSAADGYRSTENQRLYDAYKNRLKLRRSNALAIRRQRNVGRSYNYAIHEPRNIAMNPHVYVHPMPAAIRRSRGYGSSCSPRRSDMYAHYGH